MTIDRRCFVYTAASAALAATLPRVLGAQMPTSSASLQAITVPLRRNLEGLTGKKARVNIMEIRAPELDARLVARNVAEQLERRVAFRRAMKQAVQRSMRMGARGIKVRVAGRLAIPSSPTRLPPSRRCRRA